VTKTLTYDKIEVTSNGVIQVRQKLTAFDDDGTVIGERYNRYTLAPGQDVTGQPNKIQRVCNIFWDAATIAAYQVALATANPIGG
jgi:hypothetical protein